MPTFNPLSTYSASSTMRESHAVYCYPIITPHYIKWKVTVHLMQYPIILIQVYVKACISSKVQS